MTIDPELLRLLREGAGLRTQSLEGESGAALIRRRMQAVGLESVEAYRSLVERDRRELEVLAAAVAVPETWFFRYLASCEWLVGWLRERRRAAGREHGIRLLSAPCATGQEPISLAVCAAAAGWPLGSIAVHAIDSSSAALSVALRAVEQPLPLRDPLPGWAEAWFELRPEGVLPHPELFACIEFEHADLRDWGPAGSERFDVVACRNLLIYLEADARRRVMRNCERALADDGVLLLGHADHDRDLLEGFEPVGAAQSFAHRRSRRKPQDRERDGSGLHPPARSAGGPGRPAIRVPAAATEVRTAHATPRRGPSIASVRPGAADPSSVRVQEESGGLNTPKPTPTDTRRGPTTPWADAARTRTLADAGRFDEAERLCRGRLAQDPVDTTAIELLGCVRLAVGDLAEAGEWFRRLVYLSPDHVEGLLHLASIAEGHGDADQATRLRDRARRASDASTSRPGGDGEGAAA